MIFLSQEKEVITTEFTGGNSGFHGINIGPVNKKDEAENDWKLKNNKAVIINLKYLI